MNDRTSDDLLDTRSRRLARTASRVVVWATLLVGTFATTVSADAPTIPVPVVASGDAHTCALENGFVYCWGSNAFGQLGNNTTSSVPTTTPTLVAGLSGVQTIAAGGNHTCALTNGGLWCWGSNSHGQLGVSSPAQSLVPLLVNLGGVHAIAAGGAHTCAIVYALASGRVRCWGSNASGQLGTNSMAAQSHVPTNVTGLPEQGVRAIAAGDAHTCALVSGGVKCWGVNDVGQLGDGSTTLRRAPVDVVGHGSGVQAIGAASGNTCALANGGVSCWGSNDVGQLGNGTAVPSSVMPVPVSGLSSDVQAIAVGDPLSCALVDGGVKCWGWHGIPSTPIASTPVDVSGLETDVQSLVAGKDRTCAIQRGRIQCWGPNASGELGNGTLVDTLIPMPVSRLVTSRRMIAAGTGFTCVLDDGSVRCVGANHQGQMGDGSTRTVFPRPTRVTSLGRGVQAVSAGHGHVCAVVNGGVWCWGSNEFGQLGTGSTALLSRVPVPVPGLQSGVQAIAAGSGQTCALRSGGVWCWGYNNSGQVGSGSTATSLGTPQPVAGLGTGVEAIGAGGDVSCAIVNGGAWCWGANIYGMLGQNPATVPLSRVPLAIASLPVGVRAISPGRYHTCAVVSGAARCWGHNSNGQLGLGTSSTTGSYSPLYVAAAQSGVSNIFSGDRHTCALVRGAVSCWGGNLQGQLGIGSTATRNTAATVIPSLAGSVETVDSFGDHTCAIVAGAMKCWGYDHFGELGTGIAATGVGTVTSSASPVPSLLSAVSEIVSGLQHTCALTRGVVRCWGGNGLGELGNTSAYESRTPVAVPLPGLADSIAAGVNHTCAVVDGSAWCWGNNYDGQLGNGWAESTIDGGPAQVVGWSSGVEAVAAGASHSCALVSGEVYCWGSNALGQLGLDPLAVPSSYLAVPVASLGTGVLALAAGSDHSCAMRADRKVVCWGLNDHGQLGDGSTNSSHTPVVNAVWEYVVALAAGGSRTCILAANGVRCWGSNGDGTDSLTPRPPVTFATANRIRTISVNGAHTCATANDGAQCWGANAYGQLGDGTRTNSVFASVAVLGLPAGVQPTTVSTGADHSCAVVNDDAWCWGDNSLGQLGDGSSVMDSLVPMRVAAWAP